MIKARDRLQLLGQSPVLFSRHMIKLADALLRHDPQREEVAMRNLAQLFGETLALTDVMGRHQTLREADALARRKQPALFRFTTEVWAAPSKGELIMFGATPIVPHVTFAEAYDDLVSREPRLAKNADEIREAYAHHGFALQKLPQQLAATARLSLTKRILHMLASFVEKGEELTTIREQLAAVGDFTKAYAETAYRTNVATAFTAGRFKQLEDPDVKAVTPAFEYTAVRDSSVRDNHLAADGFIAGMDNAEWNRIAPPMGFNCRCDIRSVDRWELNTRGLLRKGGHVTPHYPTGFAAAGPDAGFAHQHPGFKTYG